MNINLEVSANQEFRNLKDPALREVYRSAKSGSEAPHDVSGEQLRKLVWEAYNESLGTPLVAPKPVASNKPLPEGIQKIPLSASPPVIGTGKWPYRKRIVQLMDTSEVTRQTGKTWICQGIEVHLFPGQPTSVPYVIWDRIRRMIDVTETRKVVDGEGNKVNLQVTTKEPAYPYVDMGDDPDTLHLPISGRNFYQWQCISNDHYKLTKDGGHCTRDHLKRIFRGVDEINGQDRDFINDRSDDELRQEILRQLGFYDVIEREEVELIERAEAA